MGASPHRLFPADEAILYAPRVSDVPMHTKENNTPQNVSEGCCCCVAADADDHRMVDPYRTRTTFEALLFAPSGVAATTVTL